MRSSGLACLHIDVVSRDGRRESRGELLGDNDMCRDDLPGDNGWRDELPGESGWRGDRTLPGESGWRGDRTPPGDSGGRLGVDGALRRCACETDAVSSRVGQLGVAIFHGGGVGTDCDPCVPQGSESCGLECSVLSSDVWLLAVCTRVTNGRLRAGSCTVGRMRGEHRELCVCFTEGDSATEGCRVSGKDVHTLVAGDALNTTGGLSGEGALGTIGTTGTFGAARSFGSFETFGTTPSSDCDVLGIFRFHSD